MKRGILMLLTFLLLACIFPGCGNKEVKLPDQAEDNMPDTSQTKQVVTAVTDNPIGNNSWTRLSEANIDLDADNQEEIITLYTAAQRDSQGEIMWDDGQQWLLMIEDETGFYPLISEYIQLGSIYYYISDTNLDTNTAPVVTGITSTSYNFTLTNYSYNEEKKGYEKDTVYDSGPLNTVYMSIPGYK